MLDWSLSFRWYFPLKNTGWQEHRVHFSDFTPTGCHALQISAEPGNIPISAFRVISFGDRWKTGPNNAKRQPVTFELADIRLISDAKPVFKLKKYLPASLSNFKKRMKAGENVKILCLGDSRTAGTGLRHPDGTRYADLTGQVLRDKYGIKGSRRKVLLSAEQTAGMWLRGSPVTLKKFLTWSLSCAAVTILPTECRRTYIAIS